MNADDIRYTVETLNFTKFLPGPLQQKFVDIVLDCSKPHKVPRTTTLFSEGDTEGDEGYILLEGEISISNLQKPEFTVSGPELIGEMKQFNPNNLRTSTVEAVDDLKVLLFNWADFWASAKKLGLSPEDEKQMKDALSNYAWEHFSS